MESGNSMYGDGLVIAGQLAGAVTNPLDGRAHLLTAQRAIRCSLNEGSPRGRDSVGLAPLVDGLRRELAAIGGKGGQEVGGRGEMLGNGLETHARIKPQVLSDCKPVVALSRTARASNFQPMVNKDNFDIGAALDTLIARAGKPKNLLAAHMGVSEQAVQKWIKKGTIAREHIPALCTYLGCSADELLGLRPIGKEMVSGSQSVRLDWDIVEGVALALQDTVAELRVTPPITSLIEVFARTYERIGESGITTADVVWMVRQLEQGEGQDAKAGDIPHGSRDVAGGMGRGSRST